MELTTWADVRCPWCWVGLRSLRAAVGDDGQVVRRSFLLEPDGPARPGALIDEVAVTEWGMSLDGWWARREAIREAGLRAGLDIRVETQRTVDSRGAHRLIKLAALLGSDPERAWEALFDAHLHRGVDIADPDVLREVGGDLALDAVAVDELLAGDRFGDAVRADHAEGVRRGVTAVPTIGAGGVLLSGHRSPAEITAFVRTRAVAR